MNFGNGRMILIHDLILGILAKASIQLLYVVIKDTFKL